MRAMHAPRTRVIQCECFEGPLRGGGGSGGASGAGGATLRSTLHQNTVKERQLRCCASCRLNEKLCAINEIAFSRSRKSKGEASKAARTQSWKRCNHEIKRICILHSMERLIPNGNKSIT
nr:PREDICTED: uncharacterized protein LOC105670564 [Linepithema humile]